MDRFFEETIERKQIFSGKVISLQVDDVRLPDGGQAKREIIKHPGAVAVIALTDDQKILFVEQYRKPIEQTLLEIPAGLQESGESPERTAVRELEEETGYTTDHLIHVTSCYTSAGFSDEVMHLYLAKQIERLQEPVPGDEDEFLEVKSLTWEEAQAYLKREKITDMKTNYALLHLQTLGIF